MSLSILFHLLMSETCWAHNKWNKIESDIKLVFHSSTIAMMHGPINIRPPWYVCRKTNFLWRLYRTSPLLYCTIHVANPCTLLEAIPSSSSSYYVPPRSTIWQLFVCSGHLVERETQLSTGLRHNWSGGSL